MGTVQLASKSVKTRSLDDIEDDIYKSVDLMVLKVGELLHEARLSHPRAWKSWVEERMPFGFDAAKRIEAVYLAYRELPATLHKELPKAWQALFALRSHVASGKLVAAIESGEIGPTTTQREALRKAREWSSNKASSGVKPIEPRYWEPDYLAGKLMGYSPDDLNTNVLRALRRWLENS